MKRFLIILIGLLCAPLVAYAAWQLVLLCLSLGIPVFLLLVLLVVIYAIVLFSITCYNTNMSEIALMRKVEYNSILIKHSKNEITDEQKDLLIEQLNRKYDSAEDTLLHKTIEQMSNANEIKYGRVMSAFIGILFLAPVIVGSYKFFEGETVGNIIVTKDAIYSKTGVMIADPAGNTYEWKKIEINGETYIRYFNGIILETYDLNGNLVKVEEDR